MMTLYQFLATCSEIIILFILYLIYSQCYFGVHDTLYIPQLLFNSAWAGANGGEIQICDEDKLKEQWEKDRGIKLEEKSLAQWSLAGLELATTGFTRDYWFQSQSANRQAIETRG